MQFRVIVITDPQTHTHKPTDRTDYNILDRSSASAQCNNVNVRSRSIIRDEFKVPELNVFVETARHYTALHTQQQLQRHYSKT